MGKSLAGAMLDELGIPVLDTDQLAREVVRPGSPGLEELRGAFGEQVIQSDGSLDRAALAGIVFARPDLRRSLESILHPRIRMAWQAWLTSCQEQGQCCAAVLIPLLFETQAEDQFDHVVTLACTSATQRARLETRGWDRSRIQNCLDAQWSSAQRMQMADEVWWNDGSKETLRDQVRRSHRRWCP